MAADALPHDPRQPLSSGRARPSRRKISAGGKGPALRYRQGNSWGYHPAIVPSVVYSAELAKSDGSQHQYPDEDPHGEGRQVWLRPADRPEPVAVAKNGTDTGAAKTNSSGAKMDNRRRTLMRKA